MTKYGLSTLLNNLVIGSEFPIDRWPLHITHIDTFETDLELIQLKSLLSSVIENKQCIVTKSLSDVMVGPDKNILVTELELTPELVALQNEIVTALENAGGIFKRPVLLKENFKPHITVQQYERIEVGLDILIDSVSLIDKDPGGDSTVRKVVEVFRLKK